MESDAILSQIIIRIVFRQIRRGISLCAFERLEEFESVSASWCASLMKDNNMNVLSPLCGCSICKHQCLELDASCNW